MYSDVSYAGLPRWKQYLRLSLMFLFFITETFPILCLIVAVAVLIGVYTLVMWLTGASFMAILPWALSMTLGITILIYRRTNALLLQELTDAQHYRYRLEERHSDLRNHPDLPNSIRKEMGIPERNAEGQVILKGIVFTPATTLDLDLDTPGPS